MNDAKTRTPSATSNIIIGLAFTVGGLLWLAFILFFTADAIGDYREAYSPEVGAAPPWTWHDTFQHMGGIGGFIVGFAPPTILMGYGLYLVCSTASRLMHRLAPNTQ